jgi:NADH-quinone oxidoreductase subunit L
MPVTWLTAWIGTLALVGFPFFSGFFSKDAIIEAVALSDRFGSSVAYWGVVLGVLVTSFYSFRLLYLVFHKQPRYVVDHHAGHHPPDGVLEHEPHESPLVVTVPLILLAIPSVLIGYFTIAPVLFGSWLSDAITVLPQNDVLAELSHHFHGAAAMAMHAPYTLVFWLMVGGFVLATLIYLLRPTLAGQIQQRLPQLHRILYNKYYWDEFNQNVFVRGTVGLGNQLWQKIDAGLIDGVLVNGSAKAVGAWSQIVRTLQSGYLFQYAFAMILGLLTLLTIWVVLV